MVDFVVHALVAVVYALGAMYLFLLAVVLPFVVHRDV